MKNKIILLLVILGVVAFFGQPKIKNIALEQTCANSISCIKDLSGKFDPQDQTGIFHGKLVKNPAYIAEVKPAPYVLGEQTSNKRIEVDLTHQKLYAFEDGKQVYEFFISSGKWYPTPTGEFRIWVKLRYTRMSGGNQATGTYYNLPNVPYVMFYYNNEISQARGFSLHGTYWHNNFGHSMSHGCVNMRIEDAEKIYNWAAPYGSGGSTTYQSKDNPGTSISVYGQAPNE